MGEEDDAWGRESDACVAKISLGSKGFAGKSEFCDSGVSSPSRDKDSSSNSETTEGVVKPQEKSSVPDP